MAVNWVEREKEDKRRKKSVNDFIKVGLSPIEAIRLVKLTEERKALRKLRSKLLGDSLKIYKELSAKLKFLKEQQKAGV